MAGIRRSRVRCPSRQHPRRVELSMKSQDLPIPEMNGDHRAMELARLWLVNGAARVVISPNLWADPAPWGILLADLVQHLGNAYEAQGKNRSEAISRILAAFDAERGQPTSTVTPLE
jgi:hypothetical protein